MTLWAYPGSASQPHAFLGDAKKSACGLHRRSALGPSSPLDQRCARCAEKAAAFESASKRAKSTASQGRLF